MASVNKVILVGNLGREPDIKRTGDGGAVANLAIATTSSWKDKNSGEKREETEWHKVVFYGRTAEVCAEYLKKGSGVYIEGRLKTRKWQDKDGVDRYTTEIVGESMQMLGGKSDAGQSYSQPAAPKQAAASIQQGRKPMAAMPNQFDDDIPF